MEGSAEKGASVILSTIKIKDNKNNKNNIWHENISKRQKKI